MAKLASFLLALAQITSSHSLHAAELKRDEDALAARAITLTSVDVTTSYSTAIESMQTASATIEPSLTGVSRTSNFPILYRIKAQPLTRLIEYLD
jgi:endo-1,3(4)-beta-glucanase